MCGLVGLVSEKNWPGLGPLVESMTDTLTHRGPDSSGTFIRDRIGLGFRRLAIRDLDLRASQPMISNSKRTTIVFNGEIYNSGDLARKYLPGFRWRTSGDTEVLLELFEKLGTSILPELNGMFAFAVYSAIDNTLYLARDRAGKKPLYVYQGEDFLGFGSEIRALRVFGLKQDLKQLPFFFQFGYFPAPRTFYENVSQLRPGEVVKIKGSRIASRERFHSYLNHPWGFRKEIDLVEVEKTLRDAVRIRTISDVPVGCFLSGGVDSSLIATLLSQESSKPVPVFTVSFQDPEFDEAPRAREFAKKLNLSHETIPLSPDKIPNLLDDFLDCYEQPYGDSSGLPTLALCRAVQSRVKVALSGDGGDEFFGGYSRYEWYRWMLRLHRCPSLVRSFLSMASRILGSERAPRIQRWLAAPDEAILYARIIQAWPGASATELIPEIGTSEEPLDWFREQFSRVLSDPLTQAQAFDAEVYLPDELQVKIDRASMRSSLEVRSPLLDFRMTSIGAQLSSACKLRMGLKTVLKKLLHQLTKGQYRPAPKQGFRAPITKWLRGPFRSRIEDLLHSQSTRESGWIDLKRLNNLWERFLAGANELTPAIWLWFVLASRVEMDQSALSLKKFPSIARAA